MRRPPRRAQPSWIGSLGRRLIRLGPAAVVTAALALLAVFLGLTLPVVLAVSGARESGPAASPAPRAPTDPPPVSGFEERQRRVDQAILELLADTRLAPAGASFELTSPGRLKDRAFQQKYREVPLPAGVTFDAVLARLREKVADPAGGIAVEEREFDSKTAEIAVEIDGVPTHVLVLSRSREEDDSGLPTVEEARSAVPLPERLRVGAPRAAIVIDDIGYRPQIDLAFLDLDAPLTFSVLPFTAGGAEFAEKAHERGREVMLHMPMEPVDFPRKHPGRRALFVNDTPERIVEILEEAIQSVPHAVGVNNHMGSRFTQDEERMKIALAKFQEHGLFFIDSLTHEWSVGYRLAQEMGIPGAIRNVFLDHDPEFGKVAERLGELASIAQKNGLAVGIGHPHKTTLDALRTYLPGLARRRVQIVPASEVVH